MKSIRLLIRKFCQRTEAIVKIPRVSAERNRGDSAASRRDWSSATKSGEPDHDFVLICRRAAAAGQESVE